MKNTEIYIYTHLGLGDHFITNGLVREFIARTNYSKYNLVCKYRNEKTVTQMYRDLDLLNIFLVESDEDFYCKKNDNHPVLKVGFQHIPNLNFDEVFYFQVGFDFSTKKDKFYIDRNYSRELECYNLEVPEGEYIFVHDTCSNNKFNLNIKTDFPIVKPDNLNYTPIDYLKVIENANEIHCVDSSFLNMIDLCVDHDNLFFHLARKSQFPKLLNDWSVVSYD